VRWARLLFSVVNLLQDACCTPILLKLIDFSLSYLSKGGGVFLRHIDNLIHILFEITRDSDLTEEF